MVRVGENGGEENSRRGLPMNHSRRLLEAERKRTAEAGGHSANPPNGYLKRSRAFPLADGKRMSSACVGGSNISTSSDDYTDGDYSGEDESDRKYAARGATGGVSGRHRHHRNQRGNDRNKCEWYLDMERASTPKSSSSSPRCKKSRAENSATASADVGNGNDTRPLGSLGMRQSILAMTNKLSSAANSVSAQDTHSPSAMSYYAAPTTSKQHKMRSSTSPSTGNHSSTPTVESKSRGYHPPQFMSTVPVPHHLSTQRRAFHEPITSGICPVKKGQDMPPETARGNDDQGSLGHQQRTGVGDGEKRPQFSAPDAGVYVNASPYASSIPWCMRPSISTQSTMATTKAPSVVGIAAGPVLPPPPSPPPPLTSPPLRAAVSPRSAVYRQYNMTGDSPRSTSRTPPSCMDGGLHAAAPNWPSPPRAGMHSSTSDSFFLLPLSAAASRDPALPSVPKTSRSRHRLKGSLMPQSSLSSSGDILEFGGFINHGNDCYACSVITFLLRSPLFCRALIAAPLIGSEHTMNDSNGSIFMISTKRRHRSWFLSAHHVLINFIQLLQKQEAIEYGIDLTPLKGFLPNNFFSGRQEDAHEFFMALVEKLEEESIEALRANNKQGGDRTPPAVALESGTPELLGSSGPVAEEKEVSSDTIDPACAWINELIQGKLLNIIRCQNEGCGHEIATEDPYVNLSVNLLKATSADTTLPGSLPLPFAIESNGVSFSSPLDSTASKPPRRAVDPYSLPCATADKYYDVQSLMEHSLRFAALDTYVCDACGSSKHQKQGGCLLGRAPPVLLVQLKRFATTYNIVTGVHVSKDKTPVRVNEELTLYALREEGQYDREKKRLASPVRKVECAARLWKQRMQGRGHEGGNQKEEQAKQEEEESVDETSFHVKATRYVYRLQGLVLHIGASPYAGHYVAEFAAGPQPSDVESSDDKNVSAFSRNGNTQPKVWCIADDDHVAVLTEDDVLRRRSRSTNCYLLLYEKVMEEEVTCPVWCVLPSEME